MPAAKVADPGVVTHHQTCTLCEATCGLLIESKDGAIRSIRGNPDDIISRGHICPKGVSLQDLYHDPDRQREPMIRTGRSWQAVSWDEAIDFTAKKLVELGKAFGREAIAVYQGNPSAHNLGTQFHLEPFFTQLGTRNLYSAASVDVFPLMFVCHAMYGHQAFWPVADIDNTSFFLIIGANPMVSNGSIMTTPDFPGRIRELKARGGHLAVIDPRRTETAKVADTHHFIRPGTDAFLLLAILNVLFRDGLVNPGHLSDLVAGLDKVADAVAPFTPELAETRTGIAASAIEELTHRFAAAPSAACYGRIGISIQRFGSLCTWAIQLLNLLTGNLDRRGGTLLSEPAVAVMAGPGSAGGNNRWTSRVRGLPEVGGVLPAGALADEILTPGEGQVRALVTIAGNPASSNPNVAKLDRAFASLDFLAAIDFYINETTRHADVILPPVSPLERSHYPVFTSTFGIRNFAKYSSALYPPGPGGLQEWEILERLTHAMMRLEGVEPPASITPEDYLGQELAKGFHPSVTLEALRANPHGIDLGPLRPSLRERILTNSGSIEAAPASLLADLERLRADAAGKKDGLLLIGRRNVRSNNSWFHNLPRLMARRPDHHLLMHPEDMRSRGIAEGEYVRVTSPTGCVQVQSKESNDMMPGAVCLPHGWGHRAEGIRMSLASDLPGANLNELCDEKEVDCPSNGAALTAIRVEVSRAE